MGSEPTPEQLDGSAGPLTLRPLTADLAQEWDELAVSTGASPFQRPGWVEAWVRSFAGPGGLSVATLWQGERLDAVLPLLTLGCDRICRRARRATGPTNDHTPAFDAVTRHEAAATALARGLLGAPWAPKRYDLQFLPATGVLSEPILSAAAELGGVRVLQTVQRSSPWVDVSRGWADTTASWTASLRRNLRRRERRMREQGHLSVGWIDGRYGPVSHHLEEGLQLEAAGWKGRQGTAMLSDRRTERYYRDLFSWADRAGLLRAAYLRVDSMPWAFATVLRQPPAIYLMKIAYHEGHREHAPGVHLTREILRAAVEDPEIERVELLGETEAHKLNFADGTHDQLRLRLFRGPLAGHVSRRAVIAQDAMIATARAHLPDAIQQELGRGRARLSRRLLRRRDLPATGSRR